MAGAYRGSSGGSPGFPLCKIWDRATGGLSRYRGLHERNWRGLNGAPGRIRASGLLIRSPCEWSLHGNALRRTKSQISSIHKGSIRFCLSHCVAQRCTEFSSQQPPEQPPENILIRAPFSGPACRRASRGTTVRSPGRTHFRLGSSPSSLSERMNSRGFKR